MVTTGAPVELVAPVTTTTGAELRQVLHHQAPELARAGGGKCAGALMAYSRRTHGALDRATTTGAELARELHHHHHAGAPSSAPGCACVRRLWRIDRTT